MRLFQPPYCSFLWNKCFEKVSLLRYLHNITSVLIPKFQNKAIVYFAWYTLVTYLRLLLLFCDCFPLFINDFLWKTQIPVEACFLHWWAFIKRTKLQSTFLDRSNRYVEFFIENIRFETKTQKTLKDEKLVFQKNN